jgi:hypothetical protein
MQFKLIFYRIVLPGLWAYHLCLSTVNALVGTANDKKKGNADGVGQPNFVTFVTCASVKG